MIDVPALNECIDARVSALASTTATQGYYPSLTVIAAFLASAEVDDIGDLESLAQSTDSECASFIRSFIPFLLKRQAALDEEMELLAAEILQESDIEDLAGTNDFHKRTGHWYWERPLTPQPLTMGRPSFTWMFR